MYAGGKDLLTQARTQNDVSLGQGVWWMCEMHLLLEKRRSFEDFDLVGYMYTACYVLLALVS